MAISFEHDGRKDGQSRPTPATFLRQQSLWMNEAISGTPINANPQSFPYNIFVFGRKREHDAGFPKGQFLFGRPKWSGTYLVGIDRLPEV